MNVRRLWMGALAVIMMFAIAPLADAAPRASKGSPATQHCLGHNTTYAAQKVEAGDSGKTISVWDTTTSTYIKVVVTIDGRNVYLTPVDPSIELVDVAWCIKAATTASEGTGFPIVTPHLNRGGQVPDVSYVVIRSVTTKTDTNPCFADAQTAWAAGERYVSQGNWATYTTWAPGATVNVYAGQNVLVGTATFSDVSNGKVTITISFDGMWTLNPDKAEQVKVQGYTTAPSGNPNPGGFTTYKGADLQVTVDAYAYYGIHLDVARELPGCSG